MPLSDCAIVNALALASPVKFSTNDVIANVMSLPYRVTLIPSCGVVSISTPATVLNLTSPVSNKLLNTTGVSCPT